MRVFTTVRHSAAAIAFAAFTFAPAFADQHGGVAAEVIALAKSQWAAEMAGKPGKDQNATVAEDYTEFNPVMPTRLDGKAMSTKIADVTSSDKTVFADMQNPKVQVYGDTAILTYNYVGMTKDSAGKTSPVAAKSTRVYVKMDGAWKLVHGHFTGVDVN